MYVRVLKLWIKYTFLVMALDIQLSMFIQNSSESFLVYHKEQMFVKAFVYFFSNVGILFNLS